jgi:hypothetical protein
MAEKYKKEELPKFDFKDIPIFKSVKIRLDCPEAVKTGEGTYGTWYLWMGFVENQKVTFGKDKNARIENNYTGKVIFFPTEKVNEQLELLADGKVDVEVSITKSVEEGKKGVFKKYIVEKISHGKQSASTLTKGEMALLEDISKVQSEGYKLGESDILTIAKEEKYGSITEDRMKEILKLLDE